MKKILTILIVLFTTNAYASEYTLDNLYTDGSPTYYTYLEITIYNPTIRNIKCRGFRNGKVVDTRGTLARAEYGNPDWRTIAFTGKIESAECKISGRWYKKWLI